MRIQLTDHWQKRKVNSIKYNLSINGAITIRHTQVKKINFGTDIIPLKKKVKMDLNVKCQIIKFPEDSIGENVGDHWFANEVFETASKAQFIKEKLISWTSIKNKTFPFERHY